MFITKTETKIDNSSTKGKVSITLEIEVNNASFISPNADSDSYLIDMIDSVLSAVSALITNVLHFYDKSPLMTTYSLASVKTIIRAQNELYRNVAKGMPSE